MVALDGCCSFAVTGLRVCIFFLSFEDTLRALCDAYFLHFVTARSTEKRFKAIFSTEYASVYLR